MKTISVLIVEDNNESLVLAKEALELAKLKVFPAETGLEGLKVLEREKIDVVVLDLMLPNVNGIQILKQIRTKLGLTDLPVIVCTASGHKKDVAQCAIWGVLDYILKPYDIAAFVDSVKKAVNFEASDEEVEIVDALKVQPVKDLAIEDSQNSESDIPDVQPAVNLGSTDIEQELESAEALLEDIGVSEEDIEEMEAELNGQEGIRRIEVVAATPGMELIKDVRKNNAVVIRAGTKLSETLIKKLKDWEVETLSIKVS